MHDMTNYDKIADEFQEKFGARLKDLTLLIDKLQDDIDIWKDKKFYENLSHDERDWCQEEAQKCESFHYSITKFMNAIEGIFQFFNKLKY